MTQPPPANQLPDTHVLLSIDIFDTRQRLLVRKEVRVGEIVDNILKVFSEALELNVDAQYSLTYRGEQMDRMQTIGDLELDPGEFLMFRYYEAPRAATMKFDTGPLSQHIAANLERPATIRRPTRPVFIDAQTEQEFVVERVPAYVGRPNSAVPEVNEQLVDLSNLKEAKTVSRPHARLVQDSKSNGYYIESVKQNNLVYVNEEAVEPGQKRNLKTGDVVRLGRVHLRYDERSL